LAEVIVDGESMPGGWDHREIEREGSGVLVRREQRLGVEAWLIQSVSAGALDWVVASLEAEGAVAVDVGALDTIRVERGIPRAGVDFGEDHFPQESGLESWAVSYEKGCYLGQEVVARIHYRGKVNNLLRGVVASPGVQAVAGSLLGDEEGKEVGRVTSSVFSPALTRSLGLTVLHRRHAEPGTSLRLLPKGSVEVVELPFV
jgi:folate-binding protein YgfZ